MLLGGIVTDIALQKTHRLSGRYVVQWGLRDFDVNPVLLVDFSHVVVKLDRRQEVGSSLQVRVPVPDMVLPGLDGLMKHLCTSHQNQRQDNACFSDGSSREVSEDEQFLTWQENVEAY